MWSPPRFPCSASSGRTRLRFTLALALAAGGGTGCTVITVTGKVVTTTVGVAADVTSAAVRGTGKVAGAIVRATGDVADDSVRTAAKLSKTGAVVFVETGGTVVAETPWREGLKLAAASDVAKINAALTATRVIRAGQAIAASGDPAKLALKSGDVVELARHPAP